MYRQFSDGCRGAPYVPTESAMRETVVRRLQDTESHHEWYVYVLAMTGEPLSYIVSDAKPMNVCISISPPDEAVVAEGGRTAADEIVVLSAPAGNGLYYGGAGCNSYYLFDAITGGQIELSGDNLYHRGLQGAAEHRDGSAAHGSGGLGKEPRNPYGVL